MHIGSGPGVAGLSGMQVKPLLPLRRVFIVPSGLAATIVAFLATASGAADIALVIRSAELAAGWASCAACWATAIPAGIAMPSSPAAIISGVFKVIGCLHHRMGRRTPNWF